MLAIHKLSHAIEMLLEKADKLEDTASIMQSMGDKETALVLIDVAECLLAQIGKVHAVAVKKINEQKAKADVEIPPYMQELWKERHTFYLDKKSMLEYKIKNLKTMM